MIVYLNGDYMPIHEAKISPLDRGFLFGDGIYEATPSYDGRTVALDLHIARMTEGLLWMTNSSKHIAPVVELDGQPVGDGRVGPVWEKAMTIYEAAKYEF